MKKDFFLVLGIANNSEATKGIAIKHTELLHGLSVYDKVLKVKAQSLPLWVGFLVSFECVIFFAYILRVRQIHISYTMWTVLELFTICSNHTMLRLQWTRI